MGEATADGYTLPEGAREVICREDGDQMVCRAR